MRNERENVIFEQEVQNDKNHEEGEYNRIRKNVKKSKLMRLIQNQMVKNVKNGNRGMANKVMK
jgi:hypothetical protein